ncbi:MAG: hypothetical protein AAF337_00655 [Pseudomonadota bacterium]
MGRALHITKTLLAVSAAALTIQVGEAQAFKAKYYPDCYAPVADADTLVDRPKGEGAKKVLGGLGKAAGMFGGFGGLGKAASVAQKVQVYGGYIQSAASLSQSMVEQHPEPTDRWAAYSGQMSDEAAKLGQAQAAIAEAQQCYDAAYDALAQQVADGSLKSKKAKKPLKEIQMGSKATGDLLMAALNQARNNGNAFGEALGGETQGMNVSQYYSNTASYCSPPSLGMADWCAKYGSSAAALNTDAFNKAYYSGNTAAASQIAGMHRLGALAGLGGLSGAGMSNMAGQLLGGSGGNVAPSQQSLDQLGQASGAYLEVTQALQPLVEPQQALETKVKTLPKK